MALVSDFIIALTLEKYIAASESAPLSGTGIKVNARCAHLIGIIPAIRIAVRLSAHHDLIPLASRLKIISNS